MSSIGRTPHRIVATWYYEQDPDEGGEYAQMRGNSSSERFRDVYRRCIAVFFITARIANPDADLVLVANRPWRRDASAVARRTHSLLEAAGVTSLVSPYTLMPPPLWPIAWRNQFFVIDALEALNRATEPDDLITLFDSDVVWVARERTGALWDRLAETGSLTLDLDYPPDHDINGLSRRQMTRLATELELNIDGPGVLPYSGGELIGVSAHIAGLLSARARCIWPRIVERFESGRFVGMDEAHLLSMLYSDLGISTGDARPFIKRLWTQPFRYRNVAFADQNLALWHVPAEKRYGLRRLYEALGDWTPSGDESWADPKVLGRYLGIPRNTPEKIVRDTSRAVAIRGRSLLEAIGVASD